MSTPATAPIKQRKQLERPSWMVNLDRPRFFSSWKAAARSCSRNPTSRPAYALRIVFTDQFVGLPLNGFEFPAVIPCGIFSDVGLFKVDGDFEDELARYLYDDGRPGPHEVHQIESGRIFLADNAVCERLNLDEGAWPIQAILARAWELPGHDSDFVHASYDELAYRTASEVVTACREVMPGISPSALAAVCLSFQVGAHLQDRFRRFGRTGRAQVLAGDSGNPGRLAESALYFATRLLEKYAVMLDREAYRTTADTTGAVDDTRAIEKPGEGNAAAPAYRQLTAGAIVTPPPADTSGVIQGWHPTILENERAPAARAPAPPAPDLDRVEIARPTLGRRADHERNKRITAVLRSMPNWESCIAEVLLRLDAAQISAPTTKLVGLNNREPYKSWEDYGKNMLDRDIKRALRHHDAAKTVALAVRS